MNPARIQILLADDHPAMRAGLAAIIRPEPDLEVVGEAASGYEAVELFRRLLPDITLMDVRMPGLSGTDTIRIIRGDFPSAKIIVLSSFGGEEDIYQAIRAGAATYLLKDALREQLVCVIREVHAGGHPMSPEVAERLAHRSMEAGLTARERGVLQLVSKGRADKQVAADLGIGLETVKSHMKSIFDKLHVHDRAAAVAEAVRRGILHFDS